MQFVIQNKQARMLGICGRMLPPGTHTFEICDEPIGEAQISPTNVQRILTSETFAIWQKLGWISVHNNPVDVIVQPEPKALEQVDPYEIVEPAEEFLQEGFPADLAHLKLLLAKEQVEVCDDPDVLLRWFEADSRSGVKKAIELRLEALEVMA